MSAKIPSPCIDVCKFKRQGHCIGCSMTKSQKSAYKKLDKKKKKVAFLADLVKQQGKLGKYSHWAIAFDRKCRKKGVANPVG